MAKRSKKVSKKLVPESQMRRLRKALRESQVPEISKLAGGAQGGMEVVDYMFNVYDAAEGVAAPNGIEITSISFGNSDPKRALDVEFAQFILKSVEHMLEYGKRNEANQDTGTSKS